MLIYCAHKYGGDKKNVRRAARILKDLQTLDIDNTYVSPIHCFSYLSYNEVGQETEIAMCEDLLMACDELLILSDVSYGVQKEIDLAKKCKIPIRYYKGDK